MRTFAKALALTGTTAALLVGLVTPAAATHSCPATDLVCLVTDPMTIPVGNPVVLPPAGSGPVVVAGPRVCNTTTTPPECYSTYVIIPGAYVSSAGSTLTTITIPSYGVGVSPTGVVTVYAGVPPVPTLGSPALGVTVVAQVPYLPVVVDLGASECDDIVPVTLGPVTAASTACVLTVTVTV